MGWILRYLSSIEIWLTAQGEKYAESNNMNQRSTIKGTEPEELVGQSETFK